MKYKIKEICSKITSGGTPSRKSNAYYTDGTIHWIKTQELINKNIYTSEELITEEALHSSSAKLLPINTVCLAMYGATAGNLGIFKIPAATNQACANMIVNPNKINYLYLFYSLLYNKEKLLNLAIGAAQQNLSLDTISNFEIEVPALNEQQHIVNINHHCSIFPLVLHQFLYLLQKVLLVQV